MEVKLYEKLALVVLTAFIIWILVSWADVIAHNSPSSGDYQYHNWNIFTMAFDNK